jgi:hypothetical protein
MAASTNPALSRHLALLRDRGRAGPEDLAAIKAIAGRPSLADVREIRSALDKVRIAPSDKAELDDYLWREYGARAEEIRRMKIRGDVLQIGTLCATAVGVPLLHHLLPGADADGAANFASNAVQLGIIAGEYLSGWAAARAIKRRYEAARAELSRAGPSRMVGPG